MIINVIFIAILFVFVSNAQQFYGKKEGERIERKEGEVEKEERKIEKEAEKIKKEGKLLGRLFERGKTKSEIEALMEELKKT